MAVFDAKRGEEPVLSGKRSEDRLRVLQQLPVATLGIIVLNVTATVLAYCDPIYYRCYVESYGLVPHSFRVGGLFTSTFLHDGYVHLALNMLFLLVFGSAVERVMGRLEYVLFYIGACFVSSLAHVAIVLGTLPPEFETRAMVGASGAIAGVMGVYAVRFHRQVFRFWGMVMPALLLVMAWLVLQIGLGVLGLYRDEIFGLGLKQVGYWSHLGGFGFGIVIALLSNMALQGEREYLTAQARRHESEDNILEAIRDHEMLLKYDPDNACSHVELGRLWALLEEEEESLRCYQVGIELCAAQGREERALAAVEEMRGFWPRSHLAPSTQFRLASYLEEAGEPRKAVRMFRDIAELSPESAEAQMSLLKIGQLQLGSLSDPESAAATLTGFIDRYPSSEWRPFATEALARAYRALQGA